MSTAFEAVDIWASFNSTGKKMPGDLKSAYRPPHSAEANNAEANDSGSKRKIKALAWIGLVASLLAILVPVTILGFVEFRVLDLRYDSILLPGLAVLIPIPLAVIGLVFSIAARVRNRGWLSTLGIIMGIIAFPISLGAGFVLVVGAIASVPI